MQSWGKRAVAALGVLLAVAATLTFRLPAAESGDGYWFKYEDIPPGYDFPADENVLLAYRNAQNLPAIRRHGWALWAGLTAPSQSVWHGQRLPVWETWYAAPEVFEAAYQAHVQAGGPRLPWRDFRVPTQFFHQGPVNNEQAASILAFVKFNRPAAEFIWENELYLQSTFEAWNDWYNAVEAPVNEREIPSFPKNAVTLKLVFWLIKNPESPESQNGLTALPYWDPDYPPPPGGVTPTHLTWRNCVAVDPGGWYEEGSLQWVNCNGTEENPRWVQAPVVGLDQFYTYQLRDPAEVEAARTFMTELSTSDEQERFVTDPGQLPELYDYVALMAMHTTTKEIDDWTFQTFWWSPEPDAAPFGHDRPWWVDGVWRNYQMCTAYSMVTPREPDGGPHICFNPYLEADLGPTEPLTVGNRTYPPDPMAGTRSNCQNCHRRAAWPAFKGPGTADYGRIFNDGYIAPSDPYFARVTKTDFLWSVVFNAQPKSKPE